MISSYTTIKTNTAATDPNLGRIMTVCQDLEKMLTLNLDLRVRIRQVPLKLILTYFNTNETFISMFPMFRFTVY